MSNRCESRQRNYTELCNRSSTSSHGMGHVGSRTPHNCDMFEDYWEDASVSIRSSHSWETTSTPCVGATKETDGEDDSKRFSGLACPRIRPYMHSFDANEYVASLKARRSFPPPLASCSTLSIKGGGRFVLKEMDADRPQGFFRAQRGNGRFRLDLILPEEVNDEEDCHVEDVRECVESGHVEHGEQTITGTHEDSFSGDKDGLRSHSIVKVGGCKIFDSREGLWDEGLVRKVEDVETFRPTVKNVVIEINECSTSQAVGMDVGYVKLDKSAAAHQVSKVEGETRSSLDGFFSDELQRNIFNYGKEAGFLELDGFLTENFFALSKLELDQFVADSRDGNVEQEPLWNVDGRNQALASLSPWSAKQIYLHQSAARMRPVLGLAMS